MKALHILKIVLKDTIMSKEKQYISEAMQEIEDFKNRSCGDCKYSKKDSLNFIYCNCINSPLVELITNRNFACNKWESNK